jgi:hypothetical protein
MSFKYLKKNDQLILLGLSSLHFPTPPQAPQMNTLPT